jgi:hypothetical protein
MNDLDTDYALREAERRLIVLCRQAVPDVAHKVRLRHELLSRHRELEVQRRQGRLARWSRLSPLKRLGLALPPVFAAVAASIALLVVPVLSGHQSLQAAEAQRLSPKLMANVPRITAWQWAVHETIAQDTRVQRYRASLSPLQRVYVVYGQVYFWNDGKWLQPAANLAGPVTTAYDWQWAYTLLPTTLASGDFTILRSMRVNGHMAEGIRTTLAISGERAVTVTFWVHRPTGLVLRLDRDVTFAKQEIEHDAVDYQYTSTR